MQEFNRAVNELAPGGSFIAFPAGMLDFSVVPNMLAYFALGDFYGKMEKNLV